MNTKIPQRSVSIGFDCHKRQHTIGILDPEGYSIGPNTSIPITKIGFDQARDLIETAKIKCNATKVKIGIEAASFYHLNLVSAMMTHYDDIQVFNPKLLGPGPRREVRRKKTDYKDAIVVARALHDGIKGTMPYDDLPLLEIQELYRLKSRLTKNRSDLKKRYRRNLHVLFPGYDSVISQPFSNPSTNLLGKYPSAKTVREASFDDIKTATMKKGKYGMRDRTILKVQELARKVLDCSIYYDSLIIEQGILLRMILNLDSEIEKVSKIGLKKWQQLNIKPKFFDLDGMSEEDGVKLYTEIGDPRRFDNVDKFVAFIGLDPITKRSDRKVNYGHLTKMGTRYGREILGNLVMSMRLKNPQIKAVWEKARSQNRPWNECRVICMRKLVRMIWGIENSSQ